MPSTASLALDSIPASCKRQKASTAASACLHHGMEFFRRLGLTQLVLRDATKAEACRPLMASGLPFQSPGTKLPRRQLATLQQAA